MEKQINPYQPPQAQLAEGAGFTSALDKCGAGTRFGNYIIDMIVCQVLKFMGGVVIGIFAGGDSPFIANPFLPLLIALGITAAYYVVMEMSFGRTVGKFVTGTAVVDENGQPASMQQILVRTLCRFIPFEPFSMLGSRVRGWHDSLSNTYVVRCR